MDPNNNYIYIKFATIKSNALLLYNYDNQTAERGEFLALEIAGGRLRFSYNLGSGTYKLTTAKKVSDGQFHTAIARRAGMVNNPKMSIFGASSAKSLQLPGELGGKLVTWRLLAETPTLGKTSFVSASFQLTQSPVVVCLV